MGKVTLNMTVCLWVVMLSKNVLIWGPCPTFGQPHPAVDTTLINYTCLNSRKWIAFLMNPSKILFVFPPILGIYLLWVLPQRYMVLNSEKKLFWPPKTLFVKILSWGKKSIRFYCFLPGCFVVFEMNWNR